VQHILGLISSQTIKINLKKMKHQIPGAVVGPVVRIGQYVIDYFIGRVKAGHPRFVFFYAKVGTGHPAVVVLETELHSTINKAWHVQSMRLLVKRGESMQSFSKWLSLESGELYASGFSVLGDGRRLCAYFLLPDGEQDYQFLANNYCIDVRIACTEWGERTIQNAEMAVDKQTCEALKAGEIGIEFTWQETSKKWVGRPCQVKEYNDKLAKRY
jgi:hypothetical protein